MHDPRKPLSELPSQQWLDGDWKLALDPQNVGRQAGWAVTPPASGLEDTPIPGIIQQVFPFYQGVAWYYHRFRAQIAPQPGCTYALDFGAVDYLGEAWLNGTYLGQHEGGETPFSLDVSSSLLWQAENLLAVRVLCPCNDPIDGFVLGQTPHRNRSDYRNYGNGSSMNMGGILYPVSLNARPALHLADLFVRGDRQGRVRVEVTVANAGPAAVSCTLDLAVCPAASGPACAASRLELVCPPGASTHAAELSLPQPRLWQLDDPFLYCLEAALDPRDGASPPHRSRARFGLREFKVTQGFFHLNGKRLFLRSTHTGNHFPVGSAYSPNPDLMRQDMLYAKAAGFNMVRFIVGMARPEQLDLCDELGLMVYEESFASWLLEDSPWMKARYCAAVDGMVRRDRNHPCLTIWGLLNETFDGPVYRVAQQYLPDLRQLDDSRLVLLSSGRWDRELTTGSFSNPGGSTWEYGWSIEAPDVVAPPDWVRQNVKSLDSLETRAGDVHFYPNLPWDKSIEDVFRGLGHSAGPVFLSEFGNGSLFNVIREYGSLEQMGARPDLFESSMFREMKTRFLADWERYGFEGLYPSAGVMLDESQRMHAGYRETIFNVVRSNPRFCGYNVTGMLDHGFTGEGVWRFNREWKPGVMDVMREGFAPLRFCLFAHPVLAYAGQPVELEAVLANEDVLGPGTYPVRLRVFGSRTGIVWQKQLELVIPAAAPGELPPLAVPVWKGEVSLPAGSYTWSAELLQGATPTGGLKTFRVAESVPVMALPALTGLNLPANVLALLAAQGADVSQASDPATWRPLVLVGALPAPAQDAAVWPALEKHARAGGQVILLDPASLVAWGERLPFGIHGHVDTQRDWLYHKEVIARPHGLWDGLEAYGLLNWDLFGPAMPRVTIVAADLPDDIASASFALGYCCAGGYISGITYGGYLLGEGWVYLNAFGLVQSVGQSPVSDRMLLNMVIDAAR